MDGWLDDGRQQLITTTNRNCVGPLLVSSSLVIGNTPVHHQLRLGFLGLLFFWFPRGIILDKCFRSPGSPTFQKRPGTFRSVAAELQHSSRVWRGFCFFRSWLPDATSGDRLSKKSWPTSHLYGNHDAITHIAVTPLFDWHALQAS